MHFHRVFNLYQQSGFTARCHSIVIAESKLSDSAVQLSKWLYVPFDISHKQIVQRQQRVHETKPNYQSKRKETENEITFLVLIVDYIVQPAITTDTHKKRMNAHSERTQ